MIAVTLFPTLSEPIDGTNKYFICNETLHYEKCELICVHTEKCIFTASMESLENQYKVFLKILHIFNYDRFPDFD